MNKPGEIPQLWTPEDVSTFLQLTTTKLARMRVNGDGPPWLKFGREIRYIPRRVVEWAEQQTVGPRG